MYVITKDLSIVFVIIVWSSLYVSFPAIFAMEKLSKNFITVIKVKLLVSKASNSSFKGSDFFQMLLACYKYYKYLTNSIS